LSPWAPFGNGSDIIFILSTLLEVSVMLELVEESAPKIRKSFPLIPIKVSWPAADEATVSIRFDASIKRQHDNLAIAFILLNDGCWWMMY
jgi:hypothetical protein